MQRHVDTSCSIERASAPALDATLGHALPVLDHGFVRCVDYMGNDAAIVQMARVSYGSGTKSVSDDRGLIRYLMRHWHTSPFEGCEIKLHVKLPLFVARQWIRHRTANVNEYSGRYSIMSDEFYIPDADRLGVQSSANKQGTGRGYSADEAAIILDQMEHVFGTSFGTYSNFVDEENGYNLSRELARNVLPVSVYTEWYWKTDLHNLFHFLLLRADAHAQWEIRQYADVLAALVETWVPLAYGAWVDYRRDAKTFSSMEMTALRALLNELNVVTTSEAVLKQNRFFDVEMSAREREDFIRKLGAS